MKFNLTVEMLNELIGKGNKEVSAWHKALIDILPKYNIDTPERVAAFIAQCAHESRNFTVLEENLNYSASALEAVFTKYFRDRSSKAYARKPEAIANVVYSNRMGNGSEKTGDGWKFRGRGIIQLTGCNNYTAFGESIDKDVDQVIKYVQTKEGALESACWYWNSRNINNAADAKDILKVTKLINGGTIGLEDRKKHYEHALEVFGVKKVATKTSTKKVEKVTHTLVHIQTALGLKADGISGPKTKAAISAFQKRKGLTPDGIAGPKTLNALFGD